MVVNGLIRPFALQEGQAYLWRVRLVCEPPRQEGQVQVVAYDACPAFIIIRTVNGQRLRCPREELFSLLQHLDNSAARSYT